MHDTNDWDLRYLSGDTPWTTGHDDRCLRQIIEDFSIAPCRTLEFGCGIGHNARSMAKMGFDVVGVDISPTAINEARQMTPEGLSVDFYVADILDGPVSAEPFDFVFDRGCMHCFDSDEGRLACSDAVEENLTPGGLWLTLAGNADGPDMTPGPPRLTAREVTRAIEPCFEILLMKRAWFDSENAPMMWACLSRKRETISSETP